MKNVYLTLLALLLVVTVQAKKVKFAVDMTGQTVSVNGVHIMSDFQAMVGLGPDWDPGTALMVKEGNTNIYSIIVNLPAFRKYEYRFVNGDQTYEAEFVPDASRVGYDNIDNRWLYVDSLANDTGYVGAIMFAGNAPAGKKLIRYKVNMSALSSIPLTGVHVSTTLNGFDVTKSRMYSFSDKIYEIIEYVGDTLSSFIYVNGNNNSGLESVPAACSVSGKRRVIFKQDTVLNPICFSTCAACQVGISEQTKLPGAITIFPIPATDKLYVAGVNEELMTIQIADQTGKILIHQNLQQSGVDLSQFSPGLYFLQITNANGISTSRKFIVE